MGADKLAGVREKKAPNPSVSSLNDASFFKGQNRSGDAQATLKSTEPNRCCMRLAHTKRVIPLAWYASPLKY